LKTTKTNKLSKQAAQEILDKINDNIRTVSEEFIEMGYYVDMEAGTGNNGLFVIKFVVNEK
jgi:predicted alpha-1,6-mannanase (GH76 family)